jgi:L-asparagine transporter-like permease
MNWLDFAVVGVPAAMVIAGLLELVKRLTGWKPDAKPIILVAAVLGVLLSVAAYEAKINPQFETWFSVIMAGLMVGLGAAGVYDFVHKPQE